MKRFVPMAMVLVAVLGFVATASAQNAQGSSDNARVYGEVAGAATFGDKSSGAFGAEGGFWLTRMFGVYVEGGKMQDIATSDIQDKAKLVATALGTTATAKQEATYFSAGVVARYPLGRISPMAFFGAGRSSVTNTTSFGSPLGSDVQLGGDLAGKYSGAFVTAGVGARITIVSRFFADVTYRYGSIGEHADFELKAIKTNRIQFGFGAKF